MDQKPDKDPNQQRLLMEAIDLKQRKNQNILVLKRGLRFIDERLLERNMQTNIITQEANYKCNK